MRGGTECFSPPPLCCQQEDTSWSEIGSLTTSLSMEYSPDCRPIHRALCPTPSPGARSGQSPPRPGDPLHGEAGTRHISCHSGPDRTIRDFTTISATSQNWSSAAQSGGRWASRSPVPNNVPVTVKGLTHRLLPQIVQQLQSPVGENRPVDNLQARVMTNLAKLLRWLKSSNTIEIRTL